MDLVDRILSHASEAFLRLGVRSVTLGDIAQDLGISKKTIYQHFANKEMLVKEVAEQHFTCEMDQIAQISESAPDAIAEILLIMREVVASKATMSPVLIYEVQKYFPSVWKIFEGYTSGFLRDLVRKNLERGMEEGLFRAGLDVEITTRIRIALMEAGFRADLFPPNQFSFVEIQTAMTELYLYGIVTDKGRTRLTTTKNALFPLPSV